jgi:hypothetical protein
MTIVYLIVVFVVELVAVYGSSQPQEFVLFCSYSLVHSLIGGMVRLTFHSFHPSLQANVMILVHCEIRGCHHKYIIFTMACWYHLFT